jgi:O-antigen/teichoic acid export membrane protein
MRRGIVLKRAMVGPLIRFGSWMTVTNIINPILIYMDRFFIGALISVTAVAYYATPSEVVTKLWLVSGSLIGVLFPAFSTSFVQDRRRAELLFDRGVDYILLVLFPIVLFIVALAGDGLRIWLGSDFAEKSTAVLQWMAIGAFIYSLGEVPSCLIQGVGRPDLTAKLHLIELPLYLFGLWWLIGSHGILGAAIAWVLRMGLDTILVFGMAQRLLQGRESKIGRKLATIGLSLLALWIAMMPAGLAMKGFVLLLFLLTYALVGWFLILHPEERAFIEHRLKTIKVGGSGRTYL